MNERVSNPPENYQLCPSCGLSVDESQAFCPNCEAPIGSMSSIDPMQSIRAEGFLIQRATERRPKLIVLIGAWILFLPFPMCGLFVSVDVILNGSGQGMAGFFFFWGGIALSILGIAILFKVTRNYFRREIPDDTKESLSILR